MLKHVVAYHHVERIVGVRQVREVLLFGIGIAVVSVDSQISNAKISKQPLLYASLGCHVKNPASRTYDSVPSHHVEPKKPVSFQGTATGTSRIRPSAKTKGRETAIPSPANRAIELRAGSLSAKPRALTLYYTVSLLNWHFSTSNCVKSLPQIGQHLAVLPTLDQLAHWEGGKKADVNSLSSLCKPNII